MSETIVRPLPVPGEVGIRSALLALANLGAELQTYNEEAYTIVARMPKWYGMKKAPILVRVQDYGENCRLEIELPDKGKGQELLDQISLYLVDGHRVASDITMRWVEYQEQSQQSQEKASLVQSAGRQVGKALRLIKSKTGQAPTAQQLSPTKAEVVQVEADQADVEQVAQTDVQADVVEADEADQDPAEPSQPYSALVVVPDEAGETSKNFIIVDPVSKRVKINVQPEVFVDRSSHLETCPSCQAVVLRGSQFCPNCGRPVTMEAVSGEVNEGGRNTARSSLIFGILALAANLVTLYFFLAPTIANLGAEPSEVANPLPWINILLGVFLGILPSLWLGNEARRMAKTADIYLKFRFNKPQQGRSTAQWGRILGWAAIYISIGWVLFLVGRNFM
jgi:hypothetical protein